MGLSTIDYREAAHCTHLWRDDETDHGGSGSRETPVSESHCQRDSGDDERYPLAASRLLINFLTFHI